jgi:hypothetical protein
MKNGRWIIGDSDANTKSLWRATENELVNGESSSAPQKGKEEEREIGGTANERLISKQPQQEKPRSAADTTSCCHSISLFAR